MDTSFNFEYGWFYNIIQSHTNVIGYGISLRSNPVERLNEYTNHAAFPQTFCNLYYGEQSQIISLEKYVKSQWKEFRLDFHGDVKLEWLDPKFELNLSDLENLVEERIFHYPLDSIKKIKTQFLPLTIHSKNIFVNIETNPDFYLDNINLTKNVKK